MWADGKRNHTGPGEADGHEGKSQGDSQAQAVSWAVSMRDAWTLKTRAP